MDVMTQYDRLLALETTLDPDTLLITAFSGYEAMSAPFRFEVEMVAETAKAASVKAEDLVGQKFTVDLAITSDYNTSPRRHFNGIVSRFVQGHADRRFVHYRAEVVPWLWLLTLTTDCRIFQDLSTLEIIEKLFNEFKGQYPDLVAWRNATNKQYTKLDYCVQYRESTFNFVSRLMEQDGIFYFFEHSEDGHTLVLADASSVHKPNPDQPAAVYVPKGGWDEYDNPVMTWEVKTELRSGKYTLRDFHMQMPSKSLEVNEPTRVEICGNSGLEVYDYPGEYARRFSKKERQGSVEPEATKLVKLRMEEQEVPVKETYGTSLCRGFTPGFNFKLKDHFDDKANGKYVLTSLHHSAVQTPWYVGEEEMGTVPEPYRNSFTCIPESVTFRPQRKTPKPIVQGPQTAIVVGKPGEEIWTDEFSRVKVQFHWDREGKHDDKSSCWIRVSQPWAGKGWGSVAVPRIGQEVVVDFLEGDPDQPLVTGKVYNADCMPPYPLPKQGMVSGLKSNSTPGGGGYNEMIMDDTKGKEMIRIHAQYDMDTTVEHDQSLLVKNDRTKTVNHDEKNTIKNNRTTEITDGNESLTVKTGNRDVVVQTGNETLKVNTGTKTDTIKGPYEITVNSAHFKITCGATSLTMNHSGLIEMKGTDITIHADAHVQVEGSNINSDAKVSHNTSGTLVVSDGKTVNIVKGGMVQLNP